MGTTTSSQLEKELSADIALSNEHFYGLVNFGNTCYCNSVIQALYFCQPFREKILAYKQILKKSGNQRDNLLSCLADLFSNIASQKRRVGTIAPKRFVTKLKRENELFDNLQQQDAHEFFNYLLNAISETLVDERKREISNGPIKANGTLKKSTISSHPPIEPPKATETTSKHDSNKMEPTWIQEIFQGTLTNETRCLNCETVSSKDEDFLDLSVDIEQNVSISHCLRNFSNMETLSGDQKYHCENCCSKQEAQKRMRIKKLPRLLALHLKRFKYVEQLNRYTKLSYRVLFPMELRLLNVQDSSNSDRLFDLVAVVVHCGSTPNRGHYITLVKSHSSWLLFDDDIVDKIEESSIEDFFGLSDNGGVQKNSEPMDEDSHRDQIVEYPFEEVTTGGADENRIRGNWSSKTDYLLSVFGFSFALGNLWRFPNQISTHGGLAYLVPYVTLFFLSAMPVLFMELSLGQFISLGPVAVWKVSPLFKGVGLSMVVISCILAIYYNMITAYAIFYTVNSLKFIIPWSTCGNDWNTENCSVWNRAAVEACRLLNGQVLANGTCIASAESINKYENISHLIPSGTTMSNAAYHKVMPVSTLPSLEFFHNQVLMISSGILDFHTINWQLAICLLVAWIFVFLCSFKGVKTSGKVVYCTVIVPYIFIFVLLVRFLTLPGSARGIIHFFKPKWSVLRNFRVWGDAAVQVFYSLSTCTGGLTTLASYNRFHNNVFFDIWIIGFVDLFTSLLVSSLVFSSIGFICFEMDILLDKFRLQEGIQLVFVSFAESLSKLPVAQLYAFLFFGMVTLVIFNSELFLVECVVSSICDAFPERLRKNHRHVLTFVLLAFYVLGLPLCTAAGIYWIVLLESFTATWPLIIIAFFEVMIICWIYGADNFLDNIKWMTRFYPPIYIVWKFIWKFLCPLLFLVILTFVWMEYRPLSYDSTRFPQWSIILGWTISLSPIAIIFVTAVYKYARSSGSFSKKWRDLLCPEDDWGPALAVHRAEVYPLQIPEAKKLMPGRYYFKDDSNGLPKDVSFGVNGFKNPNYGDKNVYRRYGTTPLRSSALPERETII
ncbi:sodium:neurotransmitter symporter family domain-containing protein [Ditylenchus destructor]|nr:sodium:neurotransmitter symporter family domain-containing protein [Ditylenchus destructor]